MSTVYVFDGYSVTKCMIFGYVLLVEYDDCSTEWLPFADVPYDIMYDLLSARGVPDDVRDAGHKSMEKSEPLLEYDMLVGQYVTYQNQTGIVVGNNANGTNKVLLADGKQYGIAERNLEARKEVATAVEYDGSYYLVTPKLNIISLRTGRLMKWTDANEQRQCILAKVQ